MFEFFRFVWGMSVHCVSIALTVLCFLSLHTGPKSLLLLQFVVKILHLPFLKLSIIYIKSSIFLNKLVNLVNHLFGHDRFAPLTLFIMHICASIFKLSTPIAYRIITYDHIAVNST